MTAKSPSQGNTHRSSAAPLKTALIDVYKGFLDVSHHGMALLGTAYCFGTRKHLSLELVVYLCPAWLQRVIAVFNGLITIAFASLTMLIGGWQASQSAMTQFSPIMQVPMGLIYLAVPVSAALIIALQLVNCMLIASGRISPVAESEEAL